MTVRQLEVRVVALEAQLKAANTALQTLAARLSALEGKPTTAVGYFGDGYFGKSFVG